MKIQYILVAMLMAAAGQLAQAEEQNPASTATGTEAAATATTDQPVAEQAQDAQATQTPEASETTAVTTPPPEENLTEQAGFSRGSVVRSVFTTAIQDREPVDQLNDTQGKTGNLFYFTELRDLSGQTAIHRWEHAGKVVSEVSFDVRGPRWRVWSSKSYSPGWEGEWKVSVLNGAGEVISEDTVTYSAPVVEAAPAVSSEAATDAAPAEESSGQPFEPPVNPEMIQ